MADPKKLPPSNEDPNSIDAEFEVVGAKTQKIPTGKFHPGYGCAIFVIMVLTFTGIVTWIVHSLLQQDREIATFTVEDAPPLAVNNPTDAEKTALRSKISTFADAALKGEAAQLSLSAQDCNTLLVVATDMGIGGDKDSAPYPDLVRVTGLDSSARVIRTDIRLPMNKLPWAKGRRILLGGMTVKPDIDNGSLVLRTGGISVPGKTVSEGFVNNLRNWDWLDLAKKRNSAVADALKKVTGWHIADDNSALILECSKASAPSAKP